MVSSLARDLVNALSFSAGGVNHGENRTRDLANTFNFLRGE